eukprot:CAMPEP_0178988380 /NCGR_PEP_ID=MMETSP0795-20121207/3780_1 /TAXON_ID=88552 /ORGANISM="Amoebophrya sp., Strain Ameob2" /LENGTH=2363 /DNA_ID=CAMNT_0020679651 /DNA_START=88 /DNA_END=7176 /DNA_ORIENTATION=+
MALLIPGGRALNFVDSLTSGHERFTWSAYQLVHDFVIEHKQYLSPDELQPVFRTVRDNKSDSIPPPAESNCRKFEKALNCTLVPLVKKLLKIPVAEAKRNANLQAQTSIDGYFLLWKVWLLDLRQGLSWLECHFGTDIAQEILLDSGDAVVAKEDGRDRDVFQHVRDAISGHERAAHLLLPSVTHELAETLLAFVEALDDVEDGKGGCAAGVKPTDLASSIEMATERLTGGFLQLLREGSLRLALKLDAHVGDDDDDEDVEVADAQRTPLLPDILGQIASTVILNKRNGNHERASFLSLFTPRTLRVYHLEAIVHCILASTGASDRKYVGADCFATPNPKRRRRNSSPANVERVGENEEDSKLHLSTPRLTASASFTSSSQLSSAMTTPASSAGTAAAPSKRRSSKGETHAMRAFNLCYRILMGYFSASDDHVHEDLTAMERKCLVEGGSVDAAVVEDVARGSSDASLSRALEILQSDDAMRKTSTHTAAFRRNFVLVLLQRTATSRTASQTSGTPNRQEPPPTCDVILAALASVLLQKSTRKTTEHTKPVASATSSSGCLLQTPLGRRGRCSNASSRFGSARSTQSPGRSSGSSGVTGSTERRKQKVSEHDLASLFGVTRFSLAPGLLRTETAASTSPSSVSATTTPRRNRNVTSKPGEVHRLSTSTCSVTTSVVVDDSKVLRFALAIHGVVDSLQPGGFLLWETKTPDCLHNGREPGSDSANLQQKKTGATKKRSRKVVFLDDVVENLHASTPVPSAGQYLQWCRNAAERLWVSGLQSTNPALRRVSVDALRKRKVHENQAPTALLKSLLQVAISDRSQAPLREAALRSTVSLGLHRAAKANEDSVVFHEILRKKALRDPNAKVRCVAAHAVAETLFQVDDAAVSQSDSSEPQNHQRLDDAFAFLCELLRNFLRHSATEDAASQILRDQCFPALLMCPEKYLREKGSAEATSSRPMTPGSQVFLFLALVVELRSRCGLDYQPLSVNFLMEKVFAQLPSPQEKPRRRGSGTGVQRSNSLLRQQNDSPVQNAANNCIEHFVRCVGRGMKDFVDCSWLFPDYAVTDAHGYSVVIAFYGLQLLLRELVQNGSTSSAKSIVTKAAASKLFHLCMQMRLQVVTEMNEGTTTHPVRFFEVAALAVEVERTTKDENTWSIFDLLAYQCSSTSTSTTASGGMMCEPAQQLLRTFGTSENLARALEDAEVLGAQILQILAHCISLASFAAEQEKSTVLTGLLPFSKFLVEHAEGSETASAAAKLLGSIARRYASFFEESGPSSISKMSTVVTANSIAVPPSRYATSQAYVLKNLLIDQHVLKNSARFDSPEPVSDRASHAGAAGTLVAFDSHRERTNSSWALLGDPERALAAALDTKRHLMKASERIQGALAPASLPVEAQDLVKRIFTPERFRRRASANESHRPGLHDAIPASDCQDGKIENRDIFIDVHTASCPPLCMQSQPGSANASEQNITPARKRKTSISAGLRGTPLLVSSEERRTLSTKRTHTLKIRRSGTIDSVDVAAVLPAFEEYVEQVLSQLELSFLENPSCENRSPHLVAAALRYLGKSLSPTDILDMTNGEVAEAGSSCLGSCSNANYTSFFKRNNFVGEDIVEADEDDELPGYDSCDGVRHRSDRRDSNDDEDAGDSSDDEVDDMDLDLNHRDDRTTRATEDGTWGTDNEAIVGLVTPSPPASCDTGAETSGPDGRFCPARNDAAVSSRQKQGQAEPDTETDRREQEETVSFAAGVLRALTFLSTVISDAPHENGHNNRHVTKKWAKRYIRVLMRIGSCRQQSELVAARGNSSAANLAFLALHQMSKVLRHADVFNMSGKEQSERCGLDDQLETARRKYVTTARLDLELQAEVLHFLRREIFQNSVFRAVGAQAADPSDLQRRGVAKLAYEKLANEFFLSVLGSLAAQHRRASNHAVSSSDPASAPAPMNYQFLAQLSAVYVENASSLVCSFEKCLVFELFHRVFGVLNPAAIADEVLFFYFVEKATLTEPAGKDGLGPQISPGLEASSSRYHNDHDLQVSRELASLRQYLRLLYADPKKFVARLQTILRDMSAIVVEQEHNEKLAECLMQFCSSEVLLQLYAEELTDVGFYVHSPLKFRLAPDEDDFVIDNDDCTSDEEPCTASAPSSRRNTTTGGGPHDDTSPAGEECELGESVFTEVAYYWTAGKESMTGRRSDTAMLDHINAKGRASSASSAPVAVEDETLVFDPLQYVKFLLVLVKTTSAAVFPTSRIAHQLIAFADRYAEDAHDKLEEFCEENGGGYGSGGKRRKTKSKSFTAAATAERELQARLLFARVVAADTWAFSGRVIKGEDKLTPHEIYTLATKGSCEQLSDFMMTWIDRREAEFKMKWTPPVVEW